METRGGGGRAVCWCSLLWHVAAVAGAVCLVAFSSRTDETPGVVEGTVRDAGTGSPIASCLVMVDFALDQPRSVSTDASGHFRATNLAPGLHIIQAGATPPYDDARAESVRLAPGATGVRTFRLARNANPPGLELVRPRPRRGGKGLATR